MFTIWHPLFSRGKALQNASENLTHIELISVGAEPEEAENSGCQLLNISPVKVHKNFEQKNVLLCLYKLVSTCCPPLQGLDKKILGVGNISVYASDKALSSLSRKNWMLRLHLDGFHQDTTCVVNYVQAIT